MENNWKVTSYIPILLLDPLYKKQLGLRQTEYFLIYCKIIHQYLFYSVYFLIGKFIN